VHSNFFDTTVSELPNFNTRRMKPTFLMCIRFCVNSISINSFLHNILMVQDCMSRSRTADNMYINDLLLHRQAAESDFDMPMAIAELELDDDDEYKALHVAQYASNLNLEAQLSIAGFSVSNSLYSFAEISVMFDFCYFSFYTKLGSLFYVAILLRIYISFLHLVIMYAPVIILQHTLIL
jgi:hypothetical protein